MANYRTFQIKLNTEKDAERIAWLEGQSNITEAIRDLIDWATECHAPSDEPAAVDLGAIRAVFETVLDERLPGLSLGSAGQASQDEDPEAAAKLDAMF